MSNRKCYYAVTVLLTGITISHWSLNVDAILCYKCSGRTGDGSCGTPFNENGIETCEAKACLASRVLRQMKRGENTLFIYIATNKYCSFRKLHQQMNVELGTSEKYFTTLPGTVIMQRLHYSACMTSMYI